jgi:hypothetical protein
MAPRKIRHEIDVTDDVLNPHRREEREAIAARQANSLSTRGVTLTGSESADDIALLADAVEHFERAVVSRGGDLMVDQGPGGRTREPDDAHFVLPAREPNEAVRRYIGRIERAAEAIQHQPPIDR